MPYPGMADLCPGGPLISPQLVGSTMNSIYYKRPKEETEAGTSKMAAEPVSVGSNCKSKITWETPKCHLPSSDMLEAPSSSKATALAPSTSAPKKKYTYAERRKAAMTLRSFRRSTNRPHSEEWLKQVEWAWKVIPDYGKNRPPKSAEPAKRKQSKQAPGPSTKRYKAKPFSFAEITRNRILLGVVDRGHPDGCIPRKMWRKVEGEILLKGLDLLEIEPGPPPACVDAGWYQGNVKVVACDDARSVALYKMAIGLLGEVYEGANLVALDWCNIPSKPRGRIFFPSTIKEPEKILFLLQRCNPDLPTHDWKVVKVEEHEGPTNQAVVVINSESLAKIEANKGKLSFGFMAIHMKVYRGDYDSSTNPGGNHRVVQEIVDQLEILDDDDDDIPQVKVNMDDYLSEDDKSNIKKAKEDDEKDEIHPSPPPFAWKQHQNSPDT